MKDFSIVPHFDDLDTESKYLVHKAKDAGHHAYAPYSKFLVGCAVLLDDDTIVTGTNQENAAYPSGMCAERVALYTAVSKNPEMRVKKMALVAMKKNHKDLLPATSCGSCRQVMLEFEIRQREPITVIMQTEDHQWLTAASARALLPFSFSGAHLDHH